MGHRLKILWIICSTCLVVGCASVHPSTSLGFLDDPQLLRKSSSYEDFYFYKDPGVKLSRYARFIVEPIIVSGRNVILDKYDEQHIAQYFTNEIKIAFNRQYRVTTQPDRSTLRLRGVVQVWASEPLLNVHWSTALTGVGVGGASMEVEVVDSMSGKQVLAFFSQRKGNRFKKIDGLTTWTHTENILHDWACQIQDTFDGFHGKSAFLF